MTFMISRATVFQYSTGLEAYLADLRGIETKLAELNDARIMMYFLAVPSIIYT